MASSSAEPEQDPEPDEPTFRFDQNETSTQSLLSQGGSGYESQYGSLFGSRFSLTDGSGIFVSSLALTIIVSAIAVVGIVLVTVIITLAVMLSSCGNKSTLTFQTEGLVDLCSSYRLNVELNNVQGWVPPATCNNGIFEYVHGGQYIKDIEVAVNSARRYLKGLALEGDPSYAVIVDIDETALSNAFFYQSGSYRSADDAGLTVQAYKSNKRSELEKQGYQILSVLGDQWSDIVGPATGNRTFKLPNPMYQIL